MNVVGPLLMIIILRIVVVMMMMRSHIGRLRRVRVKLHRRCGWRHFRPLIVGPIVFIVIALIQGRHQVTTSGSRNIVMIGRSRSKIRRCRQRSCAVIRGTASIASQEIGQNVI